MLAVEVEPTRFAGGQERSLFEVCRELSKEGVQIFLAYQKKGDLLSEYREFIHSELIQRNRVYRVSQTFGFLRELLSMMSYVKKQKIDLLYVNQYFDLPFYAVLSKMTGLPLICHLRLPCPDYVSKQYRFGLKQCSGCLAISNHTRQTYVQAGFDAAKIDVLYNAIDTKSLVAPNFKLALNRPLKLIYLGRIAREKGLDVLFKAYQLLRASGRKAELTILGKERGSDVPENYQSVLMSYVEEKFSSDIHFEGHVENVDQQIAQNDIVVVPSVWPEPFGRVVLEGLRNGKPVVCSQIGGMQEIFGKRDHFLFPAGDEKALMKKISELAEKQDRTQHEIEKLQQRMKENFSYSGYANRWIELVRRFK